MVQQEPTAGATIAETEFDLEQSDEESGLTVMH